MLLLQAQIPISHFPTVALYHLLTMPVVYNNQKIKLPFDISKLYNLCQPYRYTEYNVCADTCESDLNDPFAKIFPACKYHSANEFNTCNRNPNCLPDVSFIHLNARSLNCNFRQIEDYLKSLDYTFDVIAVSETWMSHNSNNFNIPGYDAYHIVRNNKKGGGVACYVKQELTSKCLTSKSMWMMYLSVPP